MADTIIAMMNQETPISHGSRALDAPVRQPRKVSDLPIGISVRAPYFLTGIDFKSEVDVRRPFAACD